VTSCQRRLVVVTCFYDNNNNNNNYNYYYYYYYYYYHRHIVTRGSCNLLAALHAVIVSRCDKFIKLWSNVRDFSTLKQFSVCL